MTNKNRLQLLLLILLMYFTTVFITQIPGVLLPFWKEDLQLSHAMVSLLGATFFLAYGLTSLPLGRLLDHVGNKRFFVWASVCLILGSAGFAVFPVFSIGLIALFVTGLGLTAFQIVGNLLVKKLDDDPEKYSKNLTLAQVIQGLGGLSGGIVIGFLVNTFGLRWTSLYYIFAAMSLILALAAAVIPIPEAPAAHPVGRRDGQAFRALLKNPLMWMFAGGIFGYVGIEQAAAIWLSTHLINTFGIVKTDAAKVVSLYWFAQSVGRFLGVAILSRLRPATALSLYAVACACSLGFAIAAPSLPLSIVGFALVGFFTSILFPVIFSLAVNSFDVSHEGTVAGILCTAIIGGAIVPPLIGVISDTTGYLGSGLVVLGVFCFGFIAILGWKANHRATPRTERAGFPDKLEILPEQD